jgi:hypothetical protein
VLVQREPDAPVGDRNRPRDEGRARGYEPAGDETGARRHELPPVDLQA